jgi:hypothetical protein
MIEEGPNKKNTEVEPSMENSEISSEELDKPLTEEQLGGAIEEKSEGMAQLENSIADTKTELGKAREALNLPESSEEPHSILTNKEALQRDKEALQRLEDERFSQLQSKKETAGDKFEKRSTRSMLLEEEKQRLTETQYKERGLYDFKIGDEVFYEGHIWQIYDINRRKPEIEQISGDGPEEILKNPLPGVFLKRGRGGHILQGTDASTLERVTPETRARFEAMKNNKGLAFK